MTYSVEIRITSDPKLLRVVRATTEQICSIIGLANLECHKIVLAVDEACSNVIRHSYKRKKGQPIFVSFKLFRTRLEIVIRDQGEPVDKKKLVPRDLGEIRPGGLGVYLIRSVMDNVKYINKIDEGNYLIMSKKISQKEQV